MLGGLRAVASGVDVPLGGRKQRAVLALLLLRAGEVVSNDEFVDALWPDSDGAGARRTLQVYVSNLRKALARAGGPPARDRLARSGTGYVLSAAEDEIDARLFERLVAEGHDHVASGRHAEGARVLSEALSLWSGPALADFAYESWAQNEARRLEESRLVAIEARLEAELGLGRDAELVPQLESLVDEHPFREVLARQLMTALYRSGRQADALDVYQKTRNRLVDELGIDPGPELQAVYKAILNQDPSLSAPAAEMRPPSNLPTPASSFVGREDELREAERVLAGTRALTVTGPGGAGKTRFAVALASRERERFPDGTFWVPLAALRDPRLVVEAARRALEAPGDLAEAIGEKQVLLVLDNFEQVVDAAADISALLSTCPNLTVLTTSRELLRIRGEVGYSLPPLSVDDGTALFCERARIDESEAVPAICSRLDGLPLAIELAAARTVLLSPEELLDRLSERLDLLKGGRDAEPRQQTLRTTIAWSYDLLTEEERTTFARFAVFVGGGSLEAVEEVCDADLETIASLLDKNLLRRRDGRIDMLSTIREFALERLDTSGEVDSVSLRHLEWCVALGEQAAPELYGADQIEWLGRLELEHDNMRAALTWGHDAGRVELVLRLTAALRTFWYRHGHVDEGRRWIELALAASESQPPELRAGILLGASAFPAKVGDWKRAQELAAEGLEVFRALGDKRGTAILLHGSGTAAVHAGDYGAARDFYDECVALLRELGDRTLLAHAISSLGDLALREGDLVRAAERTDESLAIQRELGDSFGIVVSLMNLGFIALRSGRDEEARVALEEGMLLARKLGSTDNLGYAFEGFAAVAAARHDWDRGTRLLGRAQAIRDATSTELEPGERVVHEQTLAAIGAARSEQETADGIAIGRALTDEEAIGLALETAAAAQASRIAR